MDTNGCDGTTFSQINQINSLMFYVNITFSNLANTFYTKGLTSWTEMDREL